MSSMMNMRGQFSTGSAPTIGKSRLRLLGEFLEPQRVPAAVLQIGALVDSDELRDARPEPARSREPGCLRRFQVFAPFVAGLHIHLARVGDADYVGQGAGRSAGLGGVHHL